MSSKLLKEKVSQMIVLEELIPVIYVFVVGNEPLRRYRLKKFKILTFISILLCKIGI
jgi:hypothetical protein